MAKAAHRKLAISGQNEKSATQHNHIVQLSTLMHNKGMTTTPERRKAARDDIARALASRHHAYVLHYVGESFMLPTPRPTAIAARNLGTGATECFEVESHLRSMKVNPTTASPHELDLAERRMLDEFYAFIRSHKNYFWLHWNMRNSLFGFLALEKRQRALGGRSVSISETQRIDLADRIIDIYGDGYAEPANRLRGLAIRNRLAISHLIDGDKQAEALLRGDFAAATRSLLNRVDIMYAVAIKANEGSLKTQSPVRDRIAASGGLVKWTKENPVVALSAIASPIIGAIVGALKLWQMLHNP